MYRFAMFVLPTLFWFAGDTTGKQIARWEGIQQSSSQQPGSQKQMTSQELKEASKQQDAARQKEASKQQESKASSSSNSPIQDLTTPPQGWRKVEEQMTDDTFVGKYQRKDYSGFDGRKSDDHLVVVIIGKEPRKVEEAIVKAADQLRQKSPEAFRQIRRLNPTTALIPQGTVPKEGNNEILLARGEVTASLQDMIVWIKSPVRARGKEPVTTTPRESSGGDQP